VETFSLYFATHWALEILVEKVSAFYSTELDFFCKNNVLQPGVNGMVH
jgi:hypothetical protein